MDTYIRRIIEKDLPQVSLFIRSRIVLRTRPEIRPHRAICSLIESNVIFLNLSSHSLRCLLLLVAVGSIFITFLSREGLPYLVNCSNFHSRENFGKIWCIIKSFALYTRVSLKLHRICSLLCNSILILIDLEK